VIENRDTWGTSNFPFQSARSQCLFVANAPRAFTVGTVYTDLQDPVGLECEAMDDLCDCFTANAAIHPAQAEVINRVMTRDDAQLVPGRKVVALQADTAVARLDARMANLSHKCVVECLPSRSAVISGGGA
jgi:citrate lyase subunit beta / citryl-CoA lyase